MNTKTYAQDLRSAIDRNRYATLIEKIGTQLNDRKDRFDKSDIIEQSIEIYSNHRLVWVDDIGRDHHDQKLNLDLEFKYVSNGLYTSKKKPKSVVKVKLKNSLGANKGALISNPADYYMIGQQDAIAIISWQEIEPYLVAVPDGIEAHVPFNQLTFVFKPEDVTVSKSTLIEYKKAKAEMQRQVIESV